MREDAINSIARVIFIVDWTERIRRRTTRSWAPIALGGLLRAGLADGACPLLGSLRALEAVFDARWRERGLGEMEGKTIGHSETWRAASGEIDAAGAESVDAFRDRAGEAFLSLRAEYPSESAVAVITHGGTIRSILHHFATGRVPLDQNDRAALDSPDLQTIANCSILHLARGADSVWRLACVNDVAHLGGGAVTFRDRG